MTGCGKKDGGETDQPGVTAGPETIYAASYIELQKDADSSLTPMLFTNGGVYAASYDKVGEEIPEGVTPEYEGQYDVYEYHYYFIDYAGNASPLEGYTSLQARENTGNYADFSSSSRISGLAELENGDLLALESVYRRPRGCGKEFRRVLPAPGQSAGLYYPSSVRPGGGTEPCPSGF